MNPVVSVCILTFNSASFIAEAIESAMKQTLPAIEIIIVDNGSTDATMDICAQYANTDSRIAIYKNEIPLGISGGLNSCLEKAKGEFVKILMHDDVLESNCLERMVAVFKQYPTVRLVGCSEQQIDDKGEHMKSLTPYAETGLVTGRKVAKEILITMTNIIGTPSSVLMKRETYGNGFKRSLFLFEDVEMYLRALLSGDFYFIHEPLSKIRVHATTGSSINSNTLVFIVDILQLRDMFANFMTEEGVSREQWFEIIDERILAYAGHMLVTEGITEVSARAYASKLRGLVGYDYTEELLESLASVIFYGFSRLFKVNLEARFHEEENKKLVREIGLMSESWPFKLAQPLRNLKSKLLSSGQ